MVFSELLGCELTISRADAKKLLQAGVVDGENLVVEARGWKFGEGRVNDILIQREFSKRGLNLEQLKNSGLPISTDFIADEDPKFRNKGAHRTLFNLAVLEDIAQISYEHAQQDKKSEKMFKNAGLF